MINYYSSIILLSLMTLAVLSVLIYENARIPGADKRLLYLTYALIALSAMAEWCGVYLDGDARVPAWVLQSIKCADYILTPMAGGALVFQMHLSNKWQRSLNGILVANTVFQIVSLFTGWMVTIDAQNHYVHGPLYGVFLIVSLAIIGVVAIQFVLYGRSFRRQNRKSLYGILALVVTAIFLQEFFSGSIRTAYLGLTIGAALMFIHYTEFSQLATDDFVFQQQLALETDTLTGVYSRYAYSKALKEYDAAGALPEGFAAFTIDINGLKKVNDTIGHEAGDELILGAARCIRLAFITGRCFRTGGDEFVVLTDSMNRVSADVTLSRLQREANKWHGEKVKALHLAAGYALAEDYPDLTSEKLVHEADLAMYEAKAEYYRKTGIERRRR